MKSALTSCQQLVAADGPIGYNHIVFGAINLYLFSRKGLCYGFHVA